MDKYHLNFANISGLARGFLWGVFFGAVWGGWAYYCNFKFSPSKALNAALTQFAFSFTVTLFFSLTVDALYHNSKTLAGKWLFAFTLPVAFMLGSLVLLHSLRGTPNIFLTVLPSTSIAAMYCLWRIAHGASGPCRSTRQTKRQALHPEAGFAKQPIQRQGQSLYQENQ
jgi:hypothetical protein